MIRIRVDDFPHTKDGEWARHSLAAFREFNKRLRESIGGKRYLLGVIPGRCSVDDILFIRNETDCIVGMHGTDHDELRLDRNSGNQFEPYQLVSEVKKELLTAHTALQLAVDRPVRVYMPPRNIIDGRTLQIIKDSPMKWITSGPETDQYAKLRHLHDHWIHSQPPHEYGRTDEMWERQSHNDLILRNDSDDVILTIHWTWETNIGLHHMVKFLTAIPLDRFADFGDQ